MKIYGARVNSRGVLEVYYKDDRDRHYIGYVHGNVEKMVRELEARGIKVEWEPQIKILF